ncbi:Uncharacterized protein Rs2_06841 [Raphanus sativus]|nr:Uncharacterized protein Rs2_06841 [Raphanus sativus]
MEDEFSRKASLSSRQGGTEIDVAGQLKTARIPVRLYVRSVSKDFENLEDVLEIDTWDEISYLNRLVEFLREEGSNFINSKMCCAAFFLIIDQIAFSFVLETKRVDVLLYTKLLLQVQ